MSAITEAQINAAQAAFDSVVKGRRGDALPSDVWRRANRAADRAAAAVAAAEDRATDHAVRGQSSARPHGPEPAAAPRPRESYRRDADLHALLARVAAARLDDDPDDDPEHDPEDETCECSRCQKERETMTKISTHGAGAMAMRCEWPALESAPPEHVLRAPRTAIEKTRDMCAGLAAVPRAAAHYFDDATLMALGASAINSRGTR